MSLAGPKAALDELADRLLERDLEGLDVGVPSNAIGRSPGGLPAHSGPLQPWLFISIQRRPFSGRALRPGDVGDASNGSVQTYTG